MTAGNHKGFLQMKDSIYYGPEDDGITLLFFFPLQLLWFVSYI